MQKDTVDGQDMLTAIIAGCGAIQAMSASLANAECEMGFLTTPSGESSLDSNETVRSHRIALAKTARGIDEAMQWLGDYLSAHDLCDEEVVSTTDGAFGVVPRSLRRAIADGLIPAKRDEGE